MPVIQDTDMFYRGSRELARIYRGDHILVWEPGGGHDYSQDYLTLYPGNAGEYGGNGIYFHGDIRTNLYFSLNGGEWTFISGGRLECSENDVIRLRGTYSGNGNGLSLNITGVRKVEGNVMSLIYGNSFSGQTSLPCSMSGLFSGQTVTPGYLSSLEDAGDLVLPADNLPNLSVYMGMFKGCTNLVKAPRLPASVLGPACYSDMFRDCTSLQTAPVLPSTSVETSSYSGMFQGCQSLTFVKCLATSGLDVNGLVNWLTDVSPTGTFVKASGATYPTGGTFYGGIPSGWTIVETQ